MADIEGLQSLLDANPDADQLLEFMEVLEKHRLECEANLKFEDAHLAQQRLAQLREHEQQRRREETRAAQLADRLGVEEAHMQELQQFNDLWDQKVQEFEAHAENLQTTFAQRGKQDYDGLAEKLQRETAPTTPRWTRDLLNLRKVQDTLAKQKKYAEAGRTKAEADAVEEREYGMWKQKRDAKIHVLLDQALKKQHLEMAGLLKRIASGREEQKQARKSELDRLLQRYHNVKRQLESQQNIHVKRTDTYPGVAAMTPALSGSMAASRSRPATAQQMA